MRADAMGRLIITNHFPPADLGGGPARSLDAMIRATKEPNDISVLTAANDLGGDPLPVHTDRWVDHFGASVQYMSRTDPVHMLRALHRTCESSPRLIYLNSLFNPKFTFIPLLYVRHQLGSTRPQIVLAPRGELDPGALDISTKKKNAYFAAGKTLGLFRDIVWHATNPREEQRIRELFPGARVFVRANETLLPDQSLRPRSHKGPLRVAFLSRIVPKKGLDVALEALGSVREPIVFDIYGNAEDRDYTSTCRRLAEATPDHVTVTFRGPVPHSEVRETFQDYDLSVLPTRGENFGHVIAEALSASCPVMLPDTTPWTSLVRDLGTVVDSMDPRLWTVALDRFAALEADERTYLRQKTAIAYGKWRRVASTRTSTLDEMSTWISANSENLVS